MTARLAENLDRALGVKAEAVSTRLTAPEVCVEIRPDSANDALNRRGIRASSSGAASDETPLTALHGRMAGLYVLRLEEYNQALGSLPENSEPTLLRLSRAQVDFLRRGHGVRDRFGRL